MVGFQRSSGITFFFVFWMVAAPSHSYVEFTTTSYWITTGVQGTSSPVWDCETSTLEVLYIVQYGYYSRTGTMREQQRHHASELRNDSFYGKQRTTSRHEQRITEWPEVFCKIRESVKICDTLPLHRIISFQ